MSRPYTAICQSLTKSNRSFSLRVPHFPRFFIYFYFYFSQVKLEDVSFVWNAFRVRFFDKIERHKKDRSVHIT